jgi:hypothetical protein
MEASGVRSSWLALATKSVCARLMSISTAGAGEPLDRGAAAPLPGQQLDRFRMPEGDARVLAKQVRAEDLPRRRIGDDDPLSVEHEHRQAGMLDQVAHPFRR